MKLQTATRLGLYAALELARDPERTLSAADLAERFGVSTHHLAKVLRTLAVAGLVRGGRGASGGYRFTGNPKRTTLMDIVALFELVSQCVEDAIGLDVERVELVRTVERDGRKAVNDLDENAVIGLVAAHRASSFRRGRKSVGPVGATPVRIESAPLGACPNTPKESLP